MLPLQIVEITTTVLSLETNRRHNSYTSSLIAKVLKYRHLVIYCIRQIDKKVATKFTASTRLNTVSVVGFEVIQNSFMQPSHSIEQLALSLAIFLLNKLAALV